MCKHNSMWLRMLPPLSRLCCAVTFKATARLGYTVHSSACKMWPLQVMQSNPSALRSTRQRSASSVKCLFCFLLHILSNVSVKAIMLMDPLADSTGETNPTTATTLHQSTRQNVSQSMMSMYMEFDRRERKSLKVSDIPGSQRPNHVHLGLKLMCYSAFEQFSI